MDVGDVVHVELSHPPKERRVQEMHSRFHAQYFIVFDDALAVYDDSIFDEGPGLRKCEGVAFHGRRMVDVFDVLFVGLPSQPRMVVRHLNKGALGNRTLSDMDKKNMSSLIQYQMELQLWG